MSVVYNYPFSRQRSLNLPKEAAGCAGCWQGDVAVCHPPAMLSILPGYRLAESTATKIRTKSLIEALLCAETVLLVVVLGENQGDRAKIDRQTSCIFVAIHQTSPSSSRDGGWIEEYKKNQEKLSSATPARCLVTFLYGKGEEPAGWLSWVLTRYLPSVKNVVIYVIS